MILGVSYQGQHPIYFSIRLLNTEKILLYAVELMLLNCVIGEDFQSLGLEGGQTSQF